MSLWLRSKVAGGGGCAPVPVDWRAQPPGEVGTGTGQLPSECAARPTDSKLGRPNFTRLQAHHQAHVAWLLCGPEQCPSHQGQQPRLWTRIFARRAEGGSSSAVADLRQLKQGVARSHPFLAASGLLLTWVAGNRVAAASSSSSFR